jgi:cytochrome P450
VTERGHRNAALIDTVAKCPFEYYDDARLRGVLWEEPTDAWVVTRFADVKQVLLDEETFLRPTPSDLVPGDRYVPIYGTRHPSTMSRAERLAHRRWWFSILSPSAIEAWRTGLIADVVESTIDTFAHKQSVELAAEFAGEIPIRVIAGVLGLPWTDGDWIAAIGRQLHVIDSYKGLTLLQAGGSPHSADEALAAVRAVDSLLAPHVEAARAREGAEVISRVWRDPELEGWSEEDRYGLLRLFFLGGSETTRVAIGNALYMAFARGREHQLGGGDPQLIAAFVEEALRLYGTVHMRSRVVARDVEIDGQVMQEAQRVAAVLLAGNRDEAEFPSPRAVDLSRANLRRHLAFNVGLGTCLGVNLARAELHESIARLFARLPDIRLDANATAPRMEGFTFRAITPIHAVFTVAEREQQPGRSTESRLERRPRDESP